MYYGRGVDIGTLKIPLLAMVGFIIISGCLGANDRFLIIDDDLNNSNLGDLNDVEVTGVLNNQLIVFNEDTQLWENKDLNSLIIVVSAGFVTDFTDSDLNSDGILSIEHDANRQFPTVTVFDNNDMILLPDDVLFIDIDNIDINLLSQTPLIGTWHVRVEAGQTTDTNGFIRLDGTNDQDISAEIEFPFGISTNTIGSTDANVVIDGNLVVNNSSGHSSVTIHGTAGGCLIIEDTDGAGFTFLTALNGVLSGSTTPC